MSPSLTAKIGTRREAEVSVERLVQQFGIERSDVFIAAEGDDNTAGIEEAGSDTEAGAASPENRDDANLAGRVTISVEIEDDSLADEVRATFAEFDASGVERG